MDSNKHSMEHGNLWSILIAAAAAALCLLMDLLIKEPDQEEISD